jgi:hypothetical protein
MVLEGWGLRGGTRCFCILIGAWRGLLVEVMVEISQKLLHMGRVVLDYFGIGGDGVFGVDHFWRRGKDVVSISQGGLSRGH